MSGLLEAVSTVHGLIFSVVFFTLIYHVAVFGRQLDRIEKRVEALQEALQHVVDRIQN